MTVTGATPVPDDPLLDPVLSIAHDFTEARSVAGQVEAAARLAGYSLAPVALSPTDDPAALMLEAIAQASALQARALDRMTPEKWDLLREGGRAGLDLYEIPRPGEGDATSAPVVRPEKVAPVRAGLAAADADLGLMWQATFILAVGADEALRMMEDGKLPSLDVSTIAAPIAIDLGPPPCDTYYGTWFLLIIDTCGNDTYEAPAGGADLAVNGVSVVIDTDGDDTVLPDAFGGFMGSLPAQGAGTNGGIALAVDVVGNDVRSPGPDPFDPRMGAYGGLIGGAGTNLGVGVLVDFRGDDDNRVQGFGIPGKWGGGYNCGVGVYVDFQGADTYGGDEFEMGSGWFGGVGVHVDLGKENDFYYDFSTFAQGSGGGGSCGGIIGPVPCVDDPSSCVDGFCVEPLDICVDPGVDPDVCLKTPPFCVKIRPSIPGIGFGFLLNEGGNDVYQTVSPFEQGAGALGVGILVDLLGKDIYDAPNCFSQGYASVGIGLLVDVGASADGYLNPCPPVNNGIRPNGVVGLAVDV